MSQPPSALPASESISPAAAPLGPAATRAPAESYVSALGTLRGVLTLLVVLHHALLAYHPYAPPVGPSLSAMPFWRAFPVVDAHRWSGATWIVGWNDTFFMALMFLLSGLFVWPSLRRKGVAAYARDRVLRICLPFAVCALALSPLAYIPSYLQTGAAWSWSGFWAAWRALDGWPTGPAWFLSMLLAFDAAALALYGAARAARPLASPLGRALAFVAQRPLPFAVALTALSLLTYPPLAEKFGTMRWSELGPLTFQTSRLGLYAAFFLVGLAAGAGGLAHSALVASRGLARWWWLLVPAAAIAFRASTLAALDALASMGRSAADNRSAAIGYALACATISLAMLALASRLGQRGAADAASPEARPAHLALPARLARSLQRSAYGIYLFHYAAVSWLQYAVLRAELPGFAKALFVFVAAVAITWLLTAQLRRLRPLARVL